MSFLKSFVSRSAVKPTLASRSLSTLAEIKLIGRLTQDVNLATTAGGSPYASYNIAVDNPSSFKARTADGQPDVQTSFYRISAFYAPIVEKIDSQVHSGQLGKGSLVHAIASVEQRPDPYVVKNLPDGRSFPVQQFFFNHKSVDILQPSTEYRRQKEEDYAARFPNGRPGQAATGGGGGRDPTQLQPYEDYYPDEEDVQPPSTGKVAEEEGGEEITKKEVESPVVEGETETAGEKKAE